MSARPASLTATRRVVMAQGADGPLTRVLPEEVAVAIVVNGTTLAVMMATPADLVDFARGFVLTEGVAPAEELAGAEVEVVAHPQGIEARLWLAPERAAALDARRRAAVGPVGCGLCGIDSLAGALRAVPQVAAGARLAADQIAPALAALRAQQPLHDETHAVHAAGFWSGGRIVMAREDVGRHNALDKLAGALIAGGIDAAGGAVVLTSRLSLDMVQKAASLGASIVLSVSQPTAHAVRLADDARITLATSVRGERAVYTHPDRIIP